MQCAGDHLDTVASRLTQVEHLLLYNDDDVDNFSVLEVLESVTEVKNEYQNLQKDIKEVQQLQKEMAASLQTQMRSMRQTFLLLKKKIQSQASVSSSGSSTSSASSSSLPLRATPSRN